MFPWPDICTDHALYSTVDLWDKDGTIQRDDCLWVLVYIMLLGEHLSTRSYDLTIQGFLT